MNDATDLAMNLDALPPALRDLVRVIGQTHTLRLVGVHGGARITVPHKLRTDDPLALLLGVEVFTKLVAEYGGEYLVLPKGDAYLRELRHEQVRQCQRDGLGIDDIAEQTGYTRRHVFNILGGYADTRDTFTMDMFGEESEGELIAPPAPRESQSGKANDPFGLGGRRP
ncbi:Mor transcription activator family protein [Variovorax paradoxus]|uniref:Mor transcription activator family protein n=1 Tax=Variovorax paradoxus TaxID=34073 RepID=A0A0H2MCL8_VARPD|nr:Mor transcription activator family protein [Variovorax paradoxus]KLN54720.1 Mor transcription activator family protein [Variovorax paradoxus]